MKIEYRSIGVIRTSFEDLEVMPIQPCRAEGGAGTCTAPPGEVEVFAKSAEGLSDADGFSPLTPNTTFTEAPDSLSLSLLFSTPNPGASPLHAPRGGRIRLDYRWRDRFAATSEPSTCKM